MRLKSLSFCLTNLLSVTHFAFFDGPVLFGAECVRKNSKQNKTKERKKTQGVVSTDNSSKSNSTPFIRVPWWS